MDLTTVEKVEVVITDEEKARQQRIAQRPPLTEVLNLHDFEVRLHDLRPQSGFIIRHSGHRAASHAGEGVGILQLGGRR